MMWSRKRQHGDIGGPGPRRYVFVSGHPRSGTNWVSALLNLHPEVFCRGEFHFTILRNALTRFTRNPWHSGGHDATRAVAERHFQNLVRECMSSRAAAARPGQSLPTLLGDHTPRRFSVILPPPEASYVIVVRDGRDVLVSHTFHLLNSKSPNVVPEPLRGKLESHINALAESPERYREAGQALLADPAWVGYHAHRWAEHIRHDRRELARAAKRGLADHVRLVSYEAMWNDAAAVRDDLLRMLGLDPAAAQPITRQTRTAPGFGREEDPRSFFRRGQVGDWRNHFTPDGAKWFSEKAGQALVDLGYEPDESWVGRVADPSRSVIVSTAPPVRSAAASSRT